MVCCLTLTLACSEKPQPATLDLERTLRLTIETYRAGNPAPSNQTLNHPVTPAEDSLTLEPVANESSRRNASDTAPFGKNFGTTTLDQLLEPVVQPDTRAAKQLEYQWQSALFSLLPPLSKKLNRQLSRADTYLGLRVLADSTTIEAYHDRNHNSQRDPGEEVIFLITYNPFQHQLSIVTPLTGQTSASVHFIP